MHELIKEHGTARESVARLARANNQFMNGDMESAKDVAICLRELVKLYPAHIEKEDEHFFYPSLDYFSNQEQNDMLLEFCEFDRKLIHEKYEKLVEETEKIPHFSSPTQ